MSRKHSEATNRAVCGPARKPVKEAVIVSACRTPIGAFGGSLKDMPAPLLASLTVKEALRRACIPPGEVDEVILGNVLSAGTGLNAARQAALEAGLRVDTPAFTVNKACGSGMKAVALAAQAIQAGQGEVFVAGGTESMSSAPYILEDARWGLRRGHGQLVDSMIRDGLWCPSGDQHMGLAAENLAAGYGISREAQDRFAVWSQTKAQEAVKSGCFKAEIVPVEVSRKQDASIWLDADEHPRPGTTMETLGRLRPAFKRDGTVTAGNASGINDGAACLVVMESARAEALGVEPLARITAYASAGVEPALMGLGPVSASRKALAAAGISLEDMDLFEINEAFAAQTLAVIEELRLDESRVNVLGGAIALGHPIGASGARILVTLVYALRARNLQRGLAAVCIGGGQGIAMILERL